MIPHPWIKFYVNDHRVEPRLKECSEVSRLVWLEVQFLMHARELQPYGFLAVDGEPMSVAEIAGEIRVSRPKVAAALIELEAEGVCSTTENGVIFSRRMVQDGKRRANGLESGPRGGNPKLRRNGEAEASTDNGTSNAEPPGSPVADAGGALSRARVRAEPLSSEHLSSESESERSGAHAEVVTYHSAKYRESTGEKYAFARSTDGEMVKQMLALANGDTGLVKAKIDLAFADEWRVKRGLVSLTKIRGAWSELVRAKPITAAARRDPSDEVNAAQIAKQRAALRAGDAAANGKPEVVS